MYQINATYRIGQDSMNYILQRKSKTKKEGAESWQNIGYYQTIKQLYHALVEINIKEASLSDMTALNSKVEELHSLIENMPLKKDK